MSKKSKFLSVNVMFFFGACIILFLINQLYSVLQVSLIMKSTGSILLLSTVMTAMVLPGIFILPVSGILTDKMGIFKTLVGGTGLLGVLLFSLLLVNRMNLMNKNGILLFAVLFGAISAALLPALYAAVPSLVCGEHLQKANSVMQFINQGSMLAGPLAAGIIVEKMSGQAYPVMAVSAVIAGFLFFRVKYIGKKEQEGRAEETEAPSHGSFCHLFQQPVLILLLVFTAVLNLCMIGPQPVSYMITGIVLDQCSIQNLYLISGGIIVLISILILVYSRKQTGLQTQTSS